MNNRLKKFFIRFHFVTLVIAIVDIIVKNLTAYSLEGNIAFWITISALLSGVVLFFCFSMKRPFNNLSFYFSLYALLATIVIIGFVFRSIIWFIILSILISPIYPDEKKYEQNGVIISEPFQGFLSRCCTFQLKKRELLIFEKDYGIFEEEGTINFETMKIKETEDQIELSYTTHSKEDKVKTIKK
ncbi:MAG: hypothetical protein COA32_10310 [Fluviicola sp.]|nr:MAG: hypothetical protein COA32_10310 [Fluviicola sp.]